MTTRVKFALRRDTAANWNISNPVLLDGEPGYDYTNNQLRIGHSGLNWYDLTPVTAGGSLGGTGPTGPTGAASNIAGPQGPPGVTGPASSGSITGHTGFTGPTSTALGPQGPEGIKGPAGSSSGGGGATGPTGPKGNPTYGEPGPDGLDGDGGAQGPDGPQGDQGDPGDARKTILPRYNLGAIDNNANINVIEAGGTTYTILTPSAGELNNGTLNETLSFGGVLRIKLKANNISASTGYDPLVPYLIEMRVVPVNGGVNVYQITSAGSSNPNIVYAPLVPSVIDGTTVAICSATIPIVCNNPIDVPTEIGIQFKAYSPNDWSGSSVSVNCQNGYTLDYWFDVDNYIYFEDTGA